MSFQQTHPHEPISTDTKTVTQRVSKSSWWWSRHFYRRHNRHILRVMNRHHTHTAMVILIPASIEKQIAINEFEQMIHSSPHSQQNHRRDSMMVIQNRQYEKIKGFTKFTSLRPHAGSSGGSTEQNYDFILRANHGNNRKSSSGQCYIHGQDTSSPSVKVVILFSKEGNLYYYGGQQTLDLSTNDAITNFSIETQSCANLPIVRIHATPGNQSVSISTLEEHAKKGSKLKSKMIFGH